MIPGPRALTHTAKLRREIRICLVYCAVPHQWPRIEMLIVPGVPPFSSGSTAHSTSHPSRRRLSKDDAGVVQVHVGRAHCWPASIPASTASDCEPQARSGRVAGGGGDPGALDERAVDGPGGRGDGWLLGVGRQETQRREPGVILARVGMREVEDGELNLGKLRLRMGRIGGRGC